MRHPLEEDSVNESETPEHTQGSTLETSAITNADVEVSEQLAQLESTTEVEAILTREPENVLVDVVWDFKYTSVKAAGDILWAHDALHAYKGEGVVVYRSKDSPTPASAIEIWLTTKNSPYTGILHFGHEFQQKSATLSQSEYAEMIWNTFPIKEEVVKMEKFRLTVDKEQTFVEYTSEENQLIIE